MPIDEGTRLGRYEIRSKIGEGGMGEVHLAQDTKLDRKVALKGGMRGTRLSDNTWPVQTGLRDKDQAFHWPERDFELHRAILHRITWWYDFESLRSDPRYADLVRRMGLKP